MRGTGKSSLGAMAAKQHKLKFIDLDAVIETACGDGGIKGLVASKGWPAFRKLESDTLEEVVANNHSGAIIACGGGIVETPSNRTFLVECALPVIWLQRNMDDVSAYLNQDTSRPSFDADILDVWHRRQPWYAECSTHDFVESDGDHDFEAVADEFSELVGFVQGKGRESLRGQTYFLSLTYPDLNEVPAALWPKLTRDIHAIELRVDLLKSFEPSYVHQQIALLRRRASLPVIFTVRSKGQGGGFDGDEAAFFKLLSLGPRTGCAFVDVEANWSEAARQAFLKSRGYTRAIGSLHFQTPCATTEQFLNVAKQCWHNGNVDVVKLVFTAEKAEDCFTVRQAASQLPSVGIKAPCIALLMGGCGKLSRVFNSFMTPVTHPLLPAAAAPGQLFVREILFLREALGITSPRKYKIFGSPLNLSPSPLMHNAGFDALGLPHVFSRCETTSVADVQAALKDTKCAGGSVTIPLKQDVIPLLDTLSPSAEAIGAVNTIIKAEDGTLIGDNTDWRGIRRPLAASLGKRARNSVLIVGAGGTALAAAYAVQQMSFTHVYYHNRTMSKAQDIAKKVPGVVLESLDAPVEHAFDAIISTLPPVGFKVPENCLTNK